jgi:hypothetical protein
MAAGTLFVVAPGLSRVHRADLGHSLLRACAARAEMCVRAERLSCDCESASVLLPTAVRGAPSCITVCVWAE